MWELRKAAQAEAYKARECVKEEILKQRRWAMVGWAGDGVEASRGDWRNASRQMGCVQDDARRCLVNVGVMATIQAGNQ